MLRYLLDEHLLHLAEPLRRRAPELTVWRIGEPLAPARGASDAILSSWCEAHDFILVTEDASTMMAALSAHLEQGGHVPGIFIINKRLSHWEAIAILVIAASISLPDEHRDQVRYLLSL
jgi:hypothetical protein